MRKYLRSMYVEIIAITFIILGALVIIAAIAGFFYANPVISSFATKGSDIPKAVYTSTYAALGVVLFYHMILIFLSASLLALNQDKRR